MKLPGSLGVAIEVDADLDAVCAQLAGNVGHRPGTDVQEVLCLCLYALPPLRAIAGAERIAMHLNMLKNSAIVLTHALNFIEVLSWLKIQCFHQTRQPSCLRTIPAEL